MNLEEILSEGRIRAMRAAGLWSDATLLDSFVRAVRDVPEKDAVVEQPVGETAPRRLTYRALDAAVDAIAGGLQESGVERGTVVSWQLPNGWFFVALHLACLRIGAISNPLMPIFRERELRFMLGLAESRVVVVPGVFRGFDHGAMVHGLASDLPTLRRVVIGEAELHGHPSVPAPMRADEVCQIMYTSGTTGEPKGVMHTSSTLLSHVHPAVERLGLTAADVILCSTPMSHQLGFLYGVMAPILLGATVVCQDVWNPAWAAKLIAQERVTFTIGATPFLADLAGLEAPGDVTSLRLFFSAGAPIPRTLVRTAAERLGAKVICGYGMTENGAVTMARPDDPEERIFGTDGLPQTGMEARVVDVAGRPVQAGEEGQLQVRGPSNFVGYLKRPKLYPIDADGWLDSGDLARMDAESYIRITGRSKDVIIRGGENIPVVEVEEQLYRHPSVAAVAIVAMPYPRLGERACAFVQLRPGTALDLATVTAYLGQIGMARPYHPERIEILEEMPRTMSGKIQKFVLRARAAAFVGAR